MKTLRALVKQEGTSRLVYMDESGFSDESYRTHGWCLKGKTLHSERKGNCYSRTSLIMGKQGKTLLAPVLFKGTTNSEWFNEWLEKHLFKVLPEKCTLILDNAAFHKTAKTRQLIERSSHRLLYLPPYSPDFNPIEKDFASIKKRRQFASPGTTLDEVIKEYGNYLK